jgi:hypothetical protein
MEKWAKRTTLENELRELFEKKYLYTIDDIEELTEYYYQTSYIYSKISNLQNPKMYGKLRLELKRVVSHDGKKRIGRIDAVKFYKSWRE